MKLIRANRAELGKIDVPLCMHHAREDRICLLESTAIVRDGAASARKVVRVWEGVKHELFFDATRAEVYADVLAFFDECVAAAGGGGGGGGGGAAEQGSGASSGPTVVV
jgi:alpha-beta hydrolase superfamily lysophospholipase